MEVLRQAPNSVAVEPGIDASRLIDGGTATISMPFTTTALLEGHSGKPSMSYDPRGLLHKDDRATHRIETLQLRGKRRQWVASVVEVSHFERSDRA